MANIHVDEKLIQFLSFLPMFLISLGIHEYAHAITAWRLGEDTAKNQGRLTLNPFKHADLVGTYLMPLASYTTGFALIGWAKPVPVDRRKFKNHFRDDAIVSFAGPFSNFILALLFFIAFIIVSKITSNQSDLILRMCWYGVFFNIFLFAFNLLPIPPLDGSHILFDIFPNKITAKLLNLGLYGSILLLVFIYSPLWGFFMDFINLILNLFVKTAGALNV